MRACRLCQNGTEDSWHLLSQCDALAVHRHASFYTDDVQKLPHPRLVLGYIRDSRIVKLMEPEEEAEEPDPEEEDAPEDPSQHVDPEGNEVA